MKNAYIYLNLRKNTAKDSDDRPVSLKITILIAKYCFIFSKKTISFLTKRWQNLNPAKKAILFISIIILILLMPSLKFTLKTLGFLEKDFVRSDSGFAFESNKESYFKVRFGSQDDKTVTVLNMTVEGNDFDLKLTTPPASSDSALISSVSATLQLDQSKEASGSAILGLMKQIDMQIASISADLSDISQKVKDVRHEVIDKVAGTEQTFIGPFETLRHQGKFLGEVTYHLDNHNLVENWTLSQLDNPKLVFDFQSDNLNLKVNKQQLWEIFNGNTKILEIENLLLDKNGQPVTLPEIEEQNSISGQINKLEIVFPLELINSSYSPFQLIRTYRRPEVKENNPQELLYRMFGEEIATQSAIVGPRPRYLNRFVDKLIFYEETGKTVSAVSENTVNQLLTDVIVNGLSCSNSYCLLAQEQIFIVLNGNEITALQKTASREASDSAYTRINVSDAPIGGMTISGETIFRTSQIAPNGAIYRMKNLESLEEKIYDGLNYPSLITVNKSGEYLAFLADGQLQLAKIGEKPKSITLPEAVSTISFGPENYLYAVMPDSRLKTMVILRIWPNSEIIEVLNNVTGSISSILAEEKDLLIGVKLDDNNAALTKLPWDKLEWHLFREENEN